MCENLKQFAGLKKYQKEKLMLEKNLFYKTMPH